MATLGQQLELRKQQQQTDRQTRTERIVAEEKRVQSQRKYEQLKAEAERLRTQVFIDKVENVTERYKRKGKWRTRTVRKVTDQFTDEEYAQEYSKLSPELKQFFSSPQEVLAQKQQKISQDTAQATSTINSWTAELEDKKASLEKYKREWAEKSREYRERNRESYNKRIDSYEEDIEEYEDRVRYFKNEMGKISQGYDWKDIKDFAEEKAQSSREKSQSQAELRAQYRENPSLKPIYSTENKRDATRKIVQLIDQNKTPLPEYLKNQISLTKSDINYYNAIANWSSKAGYNALPDWAKQKVLNPKAYEWQKANPSETLMFDDKGNVQYIKTTEYARNNNDFAIVTPEQYNNDIAEIKKFNVAEFEKANPDEKLLKNDDGTVYGVQSKQFGRIFAIDEYNKKIDEYNTMVSSPYYQVEQWKKENANMPLYSDNFTPVGYTGGGKGGGRTSDEDIKNIDEKIMGTIKKGINWVISKSGNIINQSGDIKIGNMPTNPSIAPITNNYDVNTINKLIGFGGGVPVRDLITPLKTNISDKREEIFLDEITKSGLKQELDAKYQTEYQDRFEKKYMEKIIRGEIDYETASAEFEKSEDAKIINKKYEAELKQRSGGRFTIQGLKLLGLGLAETGVKLIPETYGELAVTSALVYTGYKTLTYIPASVINVASGMYAVKGISDALSKTKSSAEKWGGVLTATISVGALSYSGYKWARTPTIKTENIIIKSRVSPRLQKGFLTKQSTLKTTDLAGKTTVEELYKGNKFSEQLFYGRRPIVSTNWRDLLGFKPIYRGIPTQQLGKTYYMSSFRGDYVFRTQSARQKAFDLLVKRGGLTKAQATQNLRYYQPRVIVSNYNADILVRSGDYFKTPQITIKGTRDIAHDVRVIDKELGIKTRGGAMVREKITGKGEVVGEIKGKTIYETTFDIEKRFLTKSGLEYQKLNQAGKTTTRFNQLTASTEKGDDLLTLPTANKGINIQYPYSSYAEQNLFKQIIPKGKTGFSESKSAILKNTGQPTVEIDLRKVYGISIKEEILKKAKPSDITKLQDQKYIKEVLKSLKDIYGNKPVAKVIKTTKVNGGTSSIASSEMTLKQTAQLKSTLSPVQILKNKMKDIINIATKSNSATAFAIAGAVATSQSVKVKERENIKLNMTLDNETQLTRLLDKIDETQKQNQSTAQRLGGGQSQITTPISVPSIDFDNLINPPRVPKPPRIKPNIKSSDKEKLKEKIKERQKLRSLNISAYLPDFTARAIGLRPREMNVKDALKEINKIQTGFEIRTGVKLKRYSNVNEKNLLKGIMK